MFRPLKALASALVVLALATPTLLALPASNPLVVPGSIGPGETREYRDGTFVVTGDITVEGGGTLVFENAIVLFLGGAWIITVESGATFSSVATIMQPDPTAELDQGVVEHDFRLDVAPGAAFTFTDTTVQDGYGVDVHTSLATIERVKFLRNDVGLALHDVDVAVSELNFTDNEVGIQAFGGSLTITDSVFYDNPAHIETEDTSVTLLDSDIYAGQTGLRGLRGDFDLQRNTFSEHLGPDTIAVWLTDATNALFHQNTFTDWGTSIRLENTPATISRSAFNSSASGSHVDGWTTSTDPMSWSVDNSTFAGGDVFFSAPCCGQNANADLSFKNSKLSKGQFFGIFTDTDVSNNTFNESEFQVVGPHHIHRNVLTKTSNGIRASAPSVAQGLVEDNDVRGNLSDFPVCYILANVRSERNLARDCIEAFDIHGASVSIDDEARDPWPNLAALTTGFDLSDASVSVAGAKVTGYGWGIIARQDGVTISGATVKNAVTVGVTFENGVTGASLTGSLFDGNNIAVRGVGASFAFSGNRVFGSTSYGLRAYSSNDVIAGTQNWFAGTTGIGVHAVSGASVDLASSYWGDPSGPTVASNPLGTGLAITDNVVYVPFLTSAP